MAIMGPLADAEIRTTKGEAICQRPGWMDMRSTEHHNSYHMMLRYVKNCWPVLSNSHQGETVETGILVVVC